MDLWFNHKASTGKNIFQECTRILADFVSSNTLPASAAAEAILSSVRTSPKPKDVGFEVLVLLLETVAEFSEPHDAIVRLLFAVRNVPPKPNPIYYHVHSMHRENLDNLWGLRYRWKLGDKQAPTAPERWVNYNVFTAKLARSGFDDGYFIFGFFCLRETLETTRQARESEFKKHLGPTSLDPEFNANKLMNYDLMAAAKWVLIGGPDMIRLGNTVFGETWERGLAAKTDLWDGDPGLSQGRWLLWQSRFDHMADQSYVSQEVRAMSKKASAAIGRFTTQ
ncbi:hypothetical protein N0V94_006332 [Neodidymelliopsis sp. IMI 364377]|nr:hypothetical protein N0V94_006332 [Neodidymelliopsis sp. IMI 364377]